MPWMIEDTLGWCQLCGAGHNTTQCPRAEKKKNGEIQGRNAQGIIKPLKESTAVEVSRFTEGVCYTKLCEKMAGGDAPLGKKDAGDKLDVDPVSRFDLTVGRRDYYSKQFGGAGKKTNLENARFKQEAAIARASKRTGDFRREGEL